MSQALEFQISDSEADSPGTEHKCPNPTHNPSIEVNNQEYNPGKGQSRILQKSDGKQYSIE